MKHKKKTVKPQLVEDLYFDIKFFLELRCQPYYLTCFFFFAQYVN